MDAEHSRDRQVWSLLLDDACRRIAGHLTAAEQPFLMLKGATIATWLYDDPLTRTYTDLDVLIPPADEDRVVDLLGDLGYRPVFDRLALSVISPGEQPLRSDVGVEIDLHTAIAGIGAPREDAWAVLHAGAESVDWAGVQVPTLGITARAMLLPLHLAKRGLADEKATQDLALGLQRLDSDIWRRAADLADRLQARDAFAAGLRLLPAGAEVAERLALSNTCDISVLMSADDTVFRPAVALERLLATQGLRRRIATGWSYLFPTRAWLRHSDPLASTGRWGTVVARIRRPFVVLRRAGWAFGERRRFRRRMR